jgi:hypothetical protein
VHYAPTSTGTTSAHVNVTGVGAASGTVSQTPNFNAN